MLDNTNTVLAKNKYTNYFSIKHPIYFIPLKKYVFLPSFYFIYTVIGEPDPQSPSETVEP